MQNSSVDLRRLSARDTVAGDPASSVQGINTFNLPDGAIVWCSETKCDYQLDRSSTQTGGGAITPAAGPGRWFPVPNEAAAFMSQAAWFVDPVNGNDLNDGATALTALRTLPELDRRLSGRVFDPTILAFTITLAAGTYPDPLVLAPNLPSLAQTLTIQGVMTENYAGTVTGFTAFNPAGGVRSVFTDAAADFSTLKQRIRMTSGPANAGLAWYNSIAAATDAQPGAFALVTGATSGIIPAIGNTFVLETPASIIPGYGIRVDGPGGVFLRDFKIAGTGTKQCYLWSQNNGRVFGCQFDATGGTCALFGRFVAIACMSENGFLSVASDGAITMTTHHFFSQAQIVGGYVNANNAIHDGNGTSNVELFISNGASVEDGGTVSARCFFGCLGGAELVELSDGGMWVLNSTNARFWGAAGNTATNALQVFNGSGFSYVTLPTATGAVPGNDVVLAGGAAIAWAALPAVAVAPNNAFALVRQ
jgi:hypothetical protein